jgi:hypothetical protein
VLLSPRMKSLVYKDSQFFVNVYRTHNFLLMFITQTQNLAKVKIVILKQRKKALYVHGCDCTFNIIHYVACIPGIGK